MAKLYFRHGTVGSAKTLNLLAVAHNYRYQGKKVLLMKPDLDTRFGKECIKSRAGLEMQADILVTNVDSVRKVCYKDVDCILVDEAQFLSAGVIDELRRITLDYDIPVLCYGLRTDFKSHLFEGSQRLMELADSIEEVKATCHYCNRKSILNLKHVNGVATNIGPSVDLGSEEKYFPVCYKCYNTQINQGTCQNILKNLKLGLSKTDSISCSDDIEAQGCVEKKTHANDNVLTTRPVACPK